MKILILLKGILMTLGLIALIDQKHCSCNEGIVVDKLYTASFLEEKEWYSIQMDAPMKRHIFHPEQFTIVLQSNGQVNHCEVDEDSYSAIHMFQKYKPNTCLKCIIFMYSFNNNQKANK